MQAAALKTTNNINFGNRRSSEHETKNELLLLATNRFCSADSYDRLSIEQYKEAFYLLINDTDQATKQIVGRSLAYCEFVPRAIALYFCLEDLSICTPVLANSPVLSQLDLIQIIEIKGSTHARIVAGRPDVGPSLLKRLKNLNDQETAATIEQNYALISNSIGKDANSLFETIAKKHSAHIFKPAEDLATKKAKDEAPTRSVSENQLLTAAARGGRIEQKATISAPEEPSASTLDQNFGTSIETMAKSGSRQGIAMIIQRQFNLTLATVHQIFEDKTGDTFAVLLKAAEVEPAQANRLQLLTFPEIGLSVHNAMRAVRFYAKLNSETSLTAVDQWPKSTKAPATHIPQFDEGGSSNRDARFAGERRISPTVEHGAMREAV